MARTKLILAITLALAILASIVVPVFAAQYSPGVTVGQYVKYGNFVGAGQGAEEFNNYYWLKVQVTAISRKEVTLLSTSQYKNGTAIAGNGTVSVWNVETGTENGVPSTQGSIIAGNLNQGDAIPPANTYLVNRTETRNYLGVSRSVNLLDASFSTPDYTTSLTYVYDKASGMLLESTIQTTTQAQPQPVITTISYGVIETNIFSSTNPSPTVPEFPSPILAVALFVLMLISSLLLLLTRKRR